MLVANCDPTEQIDVSLTRIGPFQVVRPLGQGGMGTVLLVENSHGELRALKLLKHMSTVGRLDRLRFEREFEVLRRLSHPHLVPVYELSEDQGTPYYTMDYIDGLTWGKAFKSLSKPDGYKFLQLTVAQLLSALSYIHSQGIVHRDLKPDNLLVNEQRGLQILDFGLARRIGASSESYSTERQLTEPGMVMGTVHYMSPEQILSNELDARTDLYSVGVMLYEALAGMLPYDGEDAITTLGRILHLPLPQMPNQAELPQGLVALVQRLLAKDPGDRFGNAQEVLESWSAAWSSPLAREGAADMSPTLAVRAPAQPKGRFIGREAEFQTLVERLKDCVSSGACPTVKLQGAVGLGKSRLIQHFLGYARSCDVDVIHCRAFEHSTTAYSLWAPVLNWCGPSVSHHSLTPFRPLLAGLFPGFELPGLADSSTDEAGNDGVTRLDPVHRFQLFEGLARAIDLHSVQRTAEVPGRRKKSAGCLIVLEDLHWADPVSLDFLRYYLETRAGAAGRAKHLFLLLCWNPDEAAARQDLQSFVRLSQDLGLQTLTLQPLSLAEMTELVEATLGHVLEGPVLERLYRETEGNPLFAEELVRSLKGEGGLELSSSASELGHHIGDSGLVRSPSAEIAFRLGRSATMSKAVVKRLASLEPTLMAVLELLAVGGFVVDFELAVKVAKSFRISERQLFDALGSLAAKKMLVEESTFRFPNQRTHEAVLVQLHESRRAELSLKWAAALENRLAKLGHLQPHEISELIRLRREAGQESKALELLIGLAREAMRRYAYEEAIALFGQARQMSEVVEVLDDGRTFDEVCLACGVSEVDLRELEADALFGAGHLEGAISCYQGILPKSGTGSGTGPLKLEESLQTYRRVRLLRKIGTAQEKLALLPQARETLESAFAILGITFSSRQTGSKLSNALGMMAGKFLSTLDRPGHWAIVETQLLGERLTYVLYLLRAKDWLSDYVAIVVLQFRVAWRLRDDGSGDSPAQSLSQALLVSGYFSLRKLKWVKAAQAALKLAAQKAETLQDSPQKAALLRNIGYVLLLSGAPLKGRRLLEQALEIAKASGDLYGQSQNCVFLTALYVYFGLLPSALQSAETVRDIADRLGNRAELILAYSDLAGLKATQGHLTEARQCLSRAAELRDSCQASCVDLIFQRAECQLTLCEGQLETVQQMADQHFLFHQSNGELPFHFVYFGLVSLIARTERFRKTGVFDFETFKKHYAHLEKLSIGFEAFGQMLLRLRAQVSYLRGKRTAALEQLAECAHWAHTHGHFLEAARTHLVLANLLEEEGLGEHHRRESERYFQLSGIVRTSQVALPAAGSGQELAHQENRQAT